MNRTTQSLQWFGFRQTLKGAIIVGLLTGFMLLLQGFAYTKSYPDQAARNQFAASLRSAPALGIIYGDSANLSVGAKGYIVYRVVPFMSVIVAVWALLTSTRLLRGNEEEGRWEIIRSGNTTALHASSNILLGFLYSFILSIALSVVLSLSMVASADIGLTVFQACVISLAIFTPGLVFACLGILTSQLTISRRRAVMYGVAIIIVSFIIRSIGSIDTTKSWLLHFTPFGWNELMSPILHPQLYWLWFIAIAAVSLTAIGLWLSRRDLGSGVLGETSMTTSRFYLLASPSQLSLRLHCWTYGLWAFGIITASAIMASIINVAVEASASSSGLSKAIVSLSNTDSQFKAAFLGAEFLFIVMSLMTMSVTIIDALKSDESKKFLDIYFSLPQKRTGWLRSQLLTGIVVILLISLGTGMVMFFIARTQGLNLEFGKIIAASVTMLGPIIFLMGLGTLLFSVYSRLAIPVMYSFILWSFVITLIGSSLTLHSILIDSSLFHYISFNLLEWPDWKPFFWLTAIGGAMMVAGTYLFTKRDIISD